MFACSVHSLTYLQETLTEPPEPYHYIMSDQLRPGTLKYYWR